LCACNFTGRLRGRPRLPGRRSGRIVSTASSSSLESCALAPEMVTASGPPARSITRWRLAPNLPRLVGSLPVCSPAREPAHSHDRVTPARSRSAQHLASAVRAPSAASATPRLCPSRRRRQRVMPLPQAISWGRISHGRPVLRTNRIPSSAVRSAIRGRPPFGLGRSGGRSGVMIAQSLSLTSRLRSPPRHHRFC
jgi:hypothetical protein